MSQSDAAMRPGVGGANVPAPMQSAAGVTNLPVALPQSFGTNAWLSVRWIISFPALMGLLLAAAALIGARQRLPDPDTWWHIAVGQHILDTHTWPTTDPYSFTATGVHWIAYEWFGEVLMAFAAHVGGFLGLGILHFSLVAIVTMLLYYYAYVRSGNWKAACLATGIVLPIASAIYSPRPQLFGYVFLLVTLICLELFRQGHSKALWILPPVFLIWVNTHGTFVFGLAAMGAYYAGGLVNFELGGLAAERWTPRQRVQLSFTFLLCCIALLITPYGTEIAAYPALMATSQPFNIANIQEWQPLSFGIGVGKYFLNLVLLVFVAHIFFPVRYRLAELAMLLFGVYAACVHIRFVLIFVMFFVPILAMFLAKWMPSYDPKKDYYALNFVVIAVLALSMLKVMPGQEKLAGLVAKDYPTGAIKYLRAHPHPTGMFNEYFYGGYLIWQLGPQQKVFIDGRADLYEYSGVFQDYMKIATLDRETLPLLQRYHITSCLIDKKGPLATLLAASGDWKQEYSDENSAIFVQSRPPAPAGN
jgi:hypothetical protein